MMQITAQEAQALRDEEAALRTALAVRQQRLVRMLGDGRSGYAQLQRQREGIERLQEELACMAGLAGAFCAHLKT